MNLYDDYVFKSGRSTLGTNLSLAFTTGRFAKIARYSDWYINQSVLVERAKLFSTYLFLLNVKRGLDLFFQKPIDFYGRAKKSKMGYDTVLV